MISIVPIAGIGKIEPGDDLAEIFAEKLQAHSPIKRSDCIVVASKVVAKARGRIVRFSTVEEKRQIIEQESLRILRQNENLIISETHHGFVCANAGIDESNTQEDTLILLPKDLDSAAHALQQALLAKHGIDVSVVISDTFGRPFRKGETNVALGIAGLKPFAELKGTSDFYKRSLKSTSIAIADEIAGAAELVMHKADGICLALVRGLPESYRGPGKGSDLVRAHSDDLFR